MKKVISLLLVTVLAMSMLTGCGSSNTTTTTNTTAAANTATTTNTTANTATTNTTAAATGNGKAIHLVNGKIEIDTQLKAAAAQYQKETGQEVVIDSIGGGADIQGTLKGDYQSGSMPDMFVIGGEGDYKTWQGKCADLSDCKFVQDTDFAFKDSESGEVVGFPYAIEGYGITYNADILTKAGIDPATLTNAAKFEEAFKTLDAKKDELGLTAVCSVAAESGQMYWSTGNHMFGYYLSGGLQRGDNTYYDELMQGKIDETRMGEFADFLAVLFKYSDPTVLTSGTYDDQLKLFAEGKAAFITQGDWIDPSLYADTDTSYKVTFKSGMLPLAWTKADMTSILADCPSWWCVYKDGENVDACKAFLDWLATSEEGQKCLITDCDMVSPYKSATAAPTTPLAQGLSAYVASGKTSSWAWSNMPSGIAQNYLGAVFESYAKDNDKAAFISNMSKAVADCIASTQ